MKAEKKASVESLLAYVEFEWFKVKLLLICCFFLFVGSTKKQFSIDTHARLINSQRDMISPEYKCDRHIVKP